MTPTTQATTTEESDQKKRFFWWWQTVGQATRPCRVSLLIAVLGGLVTTAVTQTSEALAALCDRRSSADLVVFAVAALAWGGTSWYLPRVLLRFSYPDSNEIGAGQLGLYRSLALWLPRALGVVPLLCVAFALYRCPAKGDANFWPVVMLLALTVLFAVFLIKRRALILALQAYSENTEFAWLGQALAQDLDSQYEARLVRLRELPTATLLTLLAHVLVSIVLFFGYAFNPVHFAQWLTAPTVLLASLATWIACGSIITYLSSWLRVPLTLPLILEALLVSGFVDNHVAARHVDTADFLARPQLDVDFASWRQATGARPQDPFIVVATEGGGIRAAYWTAAVLAGLQDHSPSFSSHLYAVSSVSGGSVGAATFDALLAKGATSNLRSRAAAILSNDFLAPPLARLLYTDLVQRFLPRRFSDLDRGAALEAAWTDALAREGGDNPFAEPFDTFWVKHPLLPRLFLNSTSVEHGNRVVLSYPTPAHFDDTVDGDAMAAFTLAQAIHASARFPYISPPLTIDSSGKPWGHLVDGGYFENSGAVTAREVLDAVATQPLARAIIIRYCGDNTTKTAGAARWATELTAPPDTFFAARDARGTLALVTLRRMLSPNFVEFCLFRRMGEPELPLGWMLSKSTQHEIDEQATAALKAGGLAQKVYDWLNESAQRAK